MRSTAGFTLVELLVSLGLMALVGLMLLSGISSGRRVWERADSRTNDAESIAAAQSLFRNILERAYPATRFDGSAPFVDFRGESDSVSFIGPPLAAERSASFRRYHLALSRFDQLALDSSNSMALDPNHPARRIVALADAGTLELAYFGSAPPDNSRRWRGRWQNRPTLPELVRIRVNFPPGDKRQWPELVIRPAATLDSSCLIDRSTGRCKGRA